MGKRWSLVSLDYSTKWPMTRRTPKGKEEGLERSESDEVSAFDEIQ